MEALVNAFDKSTNIVIGDQGNTTTLCVKGVTAEWLIQDHKGRNKYPGKRYNVGDILSSVKPGPVVDIAFNKKNLQRNTPLVSLHFAFAE